MKAYVEETIGHFGRIDGLYNNAGMSDEAQFINGAVVPIDGGQSQAY